MKNTETQFSKILRLSKLSSIDKKLELRCDIFSQKAFQKILHIERCRANRNAHQFSLIIFDLAADQEDKKFISSMVEKISSRVRDIDLIGWHDINKIGVVLPYTSARGAKKFINDIYSILIDSKPLPGCAVYTYPPDKQKAKDKQSVATIRKL
jgi:hypothetical protein